MDTTVDFANGTIAGHRFRHAQANLLFCADWAPVRHFSSGMIERPGSLYSDDIRAILETADYRIVNVEAVLHPDPGAAQAVWKEGPNLIGPSRAVEDLSGVGMDIGLLANNHTYDFGREGLLQTRETLEQEGIKTVGGGGENHSDPYAGLVLQCGKTPVALINFSEGEEGCYSDRVPGLAGWDLDRVCASVRNHRKCGRRVIVVPHAGKEFLPCPLPYLRTAYHRLVEAGASLIVAHHPHVPRGVEIHEGVPIFYSQGNFLFWQDHAGWFRKVGFILSVAVAEDGTLGCRMIPYRLDSAGIHRMSARQEAWFFRETESVSGSALTHDEVMAWQDAAIDAIPEDAWYRSCTGMDYTMERMREKDPVGLARLRTRLSSPSHYEFMVAGINRVLAGHHGSADPEKIRKVRLWTEAAVDEFPAFA